MLHSSINIHFCKLMIVYEMKLNNIFINAFNIIFLVIIMTRYSSPFSILYPLPRIKTPCTIPIIIRKLTRELPP